MTSEARALIEHYREVRARLRNPPNAVPDQGINLRRGREPIAEQKPEPEKSTLPVLDYPKVIPFRRSDLTFSSTLEFAAKEFSISPREIRAHTRIRAIALPRQISIYLAAKHTKHSLVYMGKHLGMDHTTMLHARKKIRLLMEEDATFRDRVQSMENRLLAAYHRTPIPAQHEPHLAVEEIGGRLPVSGISPVDKTSRSTLCDAKKDTRQPDVVG